MQFHPEFILMKVYNRTIQARDVLLNSAHVTVDHRLVVCYHAHCSHSICDPLSENPAHPAFYENRDKTGNWYSDV